MENDARYCGGKVNLQNPRTERTLYTIKNLTREIKLVMIYKTKKLR